MREYEHISSALDRLCEKEMLSPLCRAIGRLCNGGISASSAEDGIWRKEDHPRGQPGNKGQFVKKGTGAGGESSVAGNGSGQSGSDKGKNGAKRGRVPLTVGININDGGKGTLRTKTPRDVASYTKDSLVGRGVVKAEDWDAMEKIGPYRNQDGSNSATRVCKTTGRPISKELNDRITALLCGVDVPLDAITGSQEWQSALKIQAQVEKPYTNMRNNKGKIDTSLMSEDHVRENGETAKTVRDKILATMLSDTIDATTNEACKKHPAYQVQRGKRLDVVIGLPSAGKSSVFVNRLSTEHGSRVCDSDTIKGMLPEFHEGYGANTVHEESTRLNEMVLDRASRNGDNIVYPILGFKPSTLGDLAKKFKDRGYSIHLHLNDLPASKSQGRMINRWLETGRFLNPTLSSEERRRGVKEAYRATHGLWDTAEAMSNDVPFKTPPRPIDV